MPTSLPTFAVRVPEETKQRLDALAKSLGRSRNYVIAEAIERYLAEEAWLIDEIKEAVVEADASDEFYTQDDILRYTQETIERIRTVT